MEEFTNDWQIERKDGYFDNYWKVKRFNGTDYKIEVLVEEKNKSVIFWVGASSGKKRKQIKSYKHEGVDRLGGIKALLWVKDEILKFPDYFASHPRNILYEGDKVYICIHWTDRRRRDIYYRSLSREGFEYTMFDNKKVLAKQYDVVP